MTYCAQMTVEYSMNATHIVYKYIS